MKRVVLGCMLVACGGKEPAPVAPPPPSVVTVPDAGPSDAAIDDIELAMAGFRDDMCKCVDKACAEGVQDRMTKWSTKMAQEAGEQEIRRPTEAELARMTELGQGYGECLQKAMDAGTP